MMLISILAAATLFAAQGDKPGPAAARAMPQLSASDTVALCLGRRDGTLGHPSRWPGNWDVRPSKICRLGNAAQ